jgi:ubiquinone/menaquinone biosynthesis C-methylase UbiE
MRVDFDQERSWWDSKATREEQDLADETINRQLRWQEIEKHLSGVNTILDVGAGTGAFSIPLAERGFKVTHLDFSTEMLNIARKKARDIPNIRFVEANATDLSAFEDRSFDLVLNMDGAISFCGSEAETALLESCRVSRAKVVLTVSHRACMLPVWVAESLVALGEFPPAVYAMLERGEWHYEQFPENARLTQSYFGTLRAFLPHELRRFFEGLGWRVLRCGGLGSLANLCGKDTVERVLQDQSIFTEFVNLCERFDTETLPDGPGTRQRAGLIAVAERQE